MLAGKPCGVAPLLKWPGGKRSLLPALRELVPSAFTTYYEPFVGGGALFFDLCPDGAVLADHNEHLISCYEEVRDNPSAVIEILQRMPNSPEDYYRIRRWSPTTAIEAAARTIYLATLAFNGIYRVNLRGEFNVPYGHKSHLQPCDRVRVMAASEALSRAQLMRADFEDALRTASCGDFVYLDPPYTVTHAKNGFLKYNARIFSWEDQERLACIARGLTARGCTVVVSNADHPSVRRLYADFEQRTVQRPSRIAASSEFRRRVTECVFYKEPDRC